MKLRLLENLERDSDPRKRVAFAPANSSPGELSLPPARIDASVYDIAEPGYDNSTGFLPVPGFTAQMRRNVPRSDGKPGYRPADAPFGADWVEENQLREYLIRRNKIYRFAMQVGAVSGITVDLWKSSEGAIDGIALENLIQSAVASDAGAAPGLDLPRDYHTELKEALSSTTEVAPADKIGLMQLLRQREIAETAAAKRGADTTDPRFLAAGVQAAAEKQAREQAEREAKAAKAVLAQSPSLRPAASAARPSIPSAGTSTTSSVPDDQQLRDSRPRAYMTLTRDAADDELKPRDTTPVTGRDTAAQEQDREIEREREEEREKLRAAEELRDTAKGLATLDANGNIVYDVENKWAMALRLMLNNASATQFDIWRVIYDEPKRDDSRRGAAAAGKPLLTQLREILSERSAIEALLSRGQGGRNSVLAPQNIGSLYFGNTLTGAVNTAVQFIRGPMCGNKSWVADIDLMTHDRVWVDFAQLVALTIKINQSTASRYGDMTKALRGLNMERSFLLRKFATLRMIFDGFLGFAGDGGFFGEQVRQDTLRDRENTLLTTGNYRSNRFD